MYRIFFILSFCFLNNLSYGSFIKEEIKEEKILKSAIIVADNVMKIIKKSLPNYLSNYVSPLSDLSKIIKNSYKIYEKNDNYLEAVCRFTKILLIFSPDNFEINFMYNTTSIYKNFTVLFDPEECNGLFSEDIFVNLGDFFLVSEILSRKHNIVSLANTFKFLRSSTKIYKSYRKIKEIDCPTKYKKGYIHQFIKITKHSSYFLPFIKV